MSSWETGWRHRGLVHLPVCRSAGVPVFHLRVVDPLHGSVQLRAVVGDGCRVLLKHSQQRAGLVRRKMDIQIDNLSTQKGIFWSLSFFVSP